MKKDIVESSIQHLYHFMDYLEQRGARPWIDFGTALGAYREKTIISHDSDIDIGITEDDIPIVDAVLHTLEQEKKILRVHDGIWIPGSLYQFGFSVSLIKIDIYVYRCVGNKLKAKYFDAFSFHRFYIDELEKIPLGNYLLSCPRHIPQYLRLKYGEEYMTPQKWCVKYNCSWDDVSDNVGEEKGCVTAIVPLWDESVNSFTKASYEALQDRFDKVILSVLSDEVKDTYGLSVTLTSAQEMLRREGLMEYVCIQKDLPFGQDMLEDLRADYLVTTKNQFAQLKVWITISDSHLHLLGKL